MSHTLSQHIFPASNDDKIKPLVILNTNIDHTRSVLAPQAATNGSEYYYIATITCNKKLISSPSFDDFFHITQKCFSSDGLELIHYFYELQPTTHKIHVHALVKLKKDNPNAYKFNLFYKILKKGFNTDFKSIDSPLHFFNCFKYSTKQRQQYIRKVYTDIKTIVDLVDENLITTAKFLNDEIKWYLDTYTNVESASKPLSFIPNFDYIYYLRLKEKINI